MTIIPWLILAHIFKYKDAEKSSNKNAYHFFNFMIS